VTWKEIGSEAHIGYPQYMSQSVEQALELIRENGPESVDRALGLLQNTVFAFSMKVCGHQQDAEDTMQDVLLKSIPHLAKFDNPKALTVWLYRVAHNCCMSQRRKAANSPARNVPLDELMPSRFELERMLRNPEPSQEQALLSAEDIAQLKQAIMAIPLHYRMVLVLHDMEELGTEEVAQILSLREGTVRVRLHRARLLLRRQLAEPEEGGPITLPFLHAATEEVERPLRCRRLFAALSDYMDGVIDDAMCDEMDRHLHDCAPCQAFLASLKNAVAQCRSYAPRCDATRAEELRKELLPKYEQAVAALSKTSEVAADQRGS
jgi:RNA polymerase sigma-70 factor, ECF subfamily